MIGRFHLMIFFCIYFATASVNSVVSPFIQLRWQRKMAARFFLQVGHVAKVALLWTCFLNSVQYESLLDVFFNANWMGQFLGYIIILYILYIFHKPPWNERKISLMPLWNLLHVWGMRSLGAEVCSSHLKLLANTLLHQGNVSVQICLFWGFMALSTAKVMLPISTVPGQA